MKTKILYSVVVLTTLQMRLLVIEFFKFFNLLKTRNIIIFSTRKLTLGPGSPVGPGCPRFPTEP